MSCKRYNIDVMGRRYRTDIKVWNNDTPLPDEDVRERKSRQRPTLHNIFTMEKYLSNPIKTGRIETSISRENTERIINEYNLVFHEDVNRWIGDDKEVFSILSSKYGTKEFSNWSELFISFKYGR